MASRLDALVKSVVFPRPKPATFDASTHPDALLHIPCVDGETLAESGLFTNGYLFRHPASTHLLIYAHPNAVDIGMLYDELRHLSKHAQVDVLAFEYSGYGLTHSDITESSINADMLSAYWFTRTFLSVPPNRILLCGRSIGAAPAAKLCASLPAADTPSLLILQCPFTALSECIQEFSHNAVSLANFLGYNWFRTIDIIADVRCPVVLHHGTHDAIVPISHSYALREKRDTAARPCVTYFYQEDGKGHNNLSRSQLIRILLEKVNTEGLSPLRTAWPSSLVARQPLDPLLFPSDYRKQPLRLVHQRWQQCYNLERFLMSRDSLYVLLTASVCSFAMKVAYAWQVYSDIVKRNVHNTSPSSPSSPLRTPATAGSTGSSGARGGESATFAGATAALSDGARDARDQPRVQRQARTALASPPLSRGLRGSSDGRRGPTFTCEDRRCTKEEFVARCIACWGSPLGIHVPVAGLSRTADALVFGCYVPPGKCDSFDIGWQFSTRPPCPMLTIAELPMTAGLLRAVQKVVSSAPEMLTERSDSDDDRRRRKQRCAKPSPLGSSNSANDATPLDLSEGSSGARPIITADDESGSSNNNSYRGCSATADSDDGERGSQLAPPEAATGALPAFIQPDLVAAVQTECERIAGFISDEDAVNLQSLFEDFEAGCEQRLSPKARVIAGSSFAEESFDELTEWLRPYAERPRAMEMIAAEVPWDYYLFKARVLADRHRLALDMDWALCQCALEEAKIVVSVYGLFRKYHLHRVHVPSDA